MRLKAALSWYLVSVVIQRERMHHRIALSSTSFSLAVSLLDIVDAFVSNPSDGLDVGRCEE